MEPVLCSMPFLLETDKKTSENFAEKQKTIIFAIVIEH